MEHGPWAEALLGWKESSERLIWNNLWVHGFTSAAPHFGIVAKPYCARERPTTPCNTQLTPLLSSKLQQEGPEVRLFHVEWNPLSLAQCAQLGVRRQSQGPCGYQTLWRTLPYHWPVPSFPPPPFLSFPGQEPQPGLPFSPRSVFLKGLQPSRCVVVGNAVLPLCSSVQGGKTHLFYFTSVPVKKQRCSQEGPILSNNLGAWGTLSGCGQQ